MTVVVLTNAGGRIFDLPSGMPEKISDYCSYEMQGAEKSELFKKKRWDGRKRLYDRQHGKFPIGLWFRIRTLLELNGVQYDLADGRTQPDRHLDVAMAEEIDGQPVVVRPYQREAVVAAISSEQSVIRVATGGGKTVIASCLIAQLRCQTLFMVHTKDLLYQAQREISKFLGGEHIGQIGDGVVDVRPVTIATMQTIAKYLNVKIQKDSYDDEEEYKDPTDVKKFGKEIGRAVDKAEMVIWDEVHRVACDTAHDVMAAITNAYYRVGLSASPWRDDGADMMIEAAFGHVSYKISASELIDIDFLVRPIIRRHTVKASVPWYEDDRPYDTIYKQEIVENGARNEIILKYVMEFSALDVPTLVLVQQIKHGNTLKRLISDRFDPIDFVSGRDLTIKRLQAIQGMRDGEIQNLIASTIADEGLDIKRLAGLILAGGGKSSTRALQRVGRTLRPFPGKTHALIVDLADDAKYLRVHAQKRKEIYQTEPGFVILEL